MKYEAINFFDIQVGDVVQMKRPGQTRFQNRIAVAKAWNHETVGLVLEGMRPTDKLIIQQTDSRNEFRRIHIQ